MTNPSPTLHILCGKIAAGKSTLAARLGGLPGTVLMAEDDWLNAFFPEQVQSPKDYVHYSALLRRALGPFVVSLLDAGVSVVLDFPANTVEQRAWMRGMLQATHAAHQLHVLDVPDEVCLARLRARNAGGDHPFAATEAQYHLFSKHFTLPTPDEGFTVVRHEDPGDRDPA